jgi:hypothetical protein
MTPLPRPRFSHAARAIRARIWQRCRPHLAALSAFFLCFLICFFGLAGKAKAAEVPDRILAALVQVESGCEWRGIGDIKGKWARGDDGEVSPFQLAPAALTDMGVTNHARVHRDPVYAESLARLWLSRCYVKHGNWADALSAYNGGTRYRSRRARDYSERILNLASVL